MSLTNDKHNLWTKQINLIIQKKFTSNTNLASLLGRLNHASCVTPLARCLTCRIRQLCLSNEHSKLIHMTDEALLFLSLWLSFLKITQSGISINLVLERCLDGMCVADSYEHGIGGLSVKTGRDFRWSIPPHLRFRVSNNMLECVAKIVAIWIGMFEGKLPPRSCAFSGTGNTSAVGWTHKSNFCDSTNKPHLMWSKK